MSNIRIKKIKVFVTSPRVANLVVVRVETTESGLYGLGCATFTWRWKAVVAAIEGYLAPLLEGRCVDDIEDIWQYMKGSSYWRNGPVLNNALSGVDEALWDIKGKLAAMPLYSLLGGRSRTGLAVYRHADGDTYDEVAENIQSLINLGYRYIRCHQGMYGGNTGGGLQEIAKPREAFDGGSYYDPRQYMRSTVELFRRVRSDFGWDIELLHDIHERLQLSDALSLVKKMEEFDLFYLEDALPPSQGEYFRYLREQTAVPLAIGEIFTNSVEWKRLVQNQWIDFIRCHISDIGGLTPALKLANFCDAYGVRTAFHGPSDICPVGVVCQMHLDMHIHNFGIQEFMGFTDEEREVFPGCPEMPTDGYIYLSDRPGIGVDFDEEAAKKYPPREIPHWKMLTRITDGTAVRP